VYVRVAVRAKTLAAKKASPVVPNRLAGASIIDWRDGGKRYLSSGGL
jgi:hypothetical protein